MNEEDKKGKLLKKIKNTILLILIALLIGFALGYYFGYDIGFEKAARILTN